MGVVGKVLAASEREWANARSASRSKMGGVLCSGRGRDGRVGPPGAILRTFRRCVLIIDPMANFLGEAGGSRKKPGFLDPGWDG